MFCTPQHRTLIIDWWEKKELNCPLVLAPDAKQQFEPCYAFPKNQSKNKAVYFMKPDKDFVVTKDNVRTRTRASSPYPSFFRVCVCSWVQFAICHTPTD